ncbi:MAG: tyrosine-type recombinase/integrase [Alphaproteobacteria bacterium]|nr:tyrosine-type recombinase/integrase [Alphaproteobacteria bacterium]
MTATALKYAGIKINPHLYRHIAAYLYLKRNPNDIETIRRLLGHKRIETTLKFYAVFDQELANQRYIDSVLATRFDAARDGR